MRKLNTTASSFIAATIIASGITLGVEFLPDILRAAGGVHYSSAGGVSTSAQAAPGAGVAGPGNQVWAASAPGRIEPRNGEIRIVSQIPGKIARVLVAVNDEVREGELLFRLEDEEYRARVDAADVEAAVRMRERDNDNVGKLAKDRRAVEDALDKAQHALFNARLELDRLTEARRSGQASEDEIAKARTAIDSNRAAVERERANLQKLQTNTAMPLPTRLEASLAVARSELAVAETMLSRTRIRAPSNGTVLQVHAKVGEMTGPQSALPMVVIGDLSALRVRAEIVERDIDKVRVGQGAVVTSDAFPNRQFEGRVIEVGRSLAMPLVAQKGPRRPDDYEVLEVLVELSGGTPLLPGMRADVFFKQETDQSTAQSKTQQAAPAQQPQAAVKSN